ncbi:CoA transferase [Myxococcota bacterium]|nr:CoA transferase [Myxococcota bacterium]
MVSAPSHSHSPSAVPHPGPLEGHRFTHAGEGASADYAVWLLRSLGAEVELAPPIAKAASILHPAIVWARSGAMWLSGSQGGPPRLAPGPVAACAAGAAQALGALGGRALADLDGAALLGERAALTGLTRRGRVSPGGGCRLLKVADGWLALGLPREDDWSCLPAWLADELGELPPVLSGEDRRWDALAGRVSQRSCAELLERARLLGLPAARVRPPEAGPVDWLRWTSGPPRFGVRERPLRVIDLSSLWAGPLCTQLLRLAGARVIKLESRTRPDGARRGAPAFFELLNGGKESVALDFGDASDLAALRALIDSADVVVESARPRALRQLGVAAEAFAGTGRGRLWLSITGYGRREPKGGWVALGDDAAVDAGMSWPENPDVSPVFFGDALADPLTGLHAAVAVLACVRAGRGGLLDVNLRDVVAHALAFEPEHPAARRAAFVEALDDGGHEVRAGGERVRVKPPRGRTLGAPARQLGSDTQRVLEEIEKPC